MFDMSSLQISKLNSQGKQLDHDESNTQKNKGVLLKNMKMSHLMSKNQHLHV